MFCVITYTSLLDITPQTEGSRVVMMLLIVISLAVLPSLIADALNTLRKRNGKQVYTTVLQINARIRLGRICLWVIKTFYIARWFISTRTSYRDIRRILEYGKRDFFTLYSTLFISSLNVKENTEPHLNVVFLDINRPNEESKYLERNSMWGHRIQFIHGSVLVSTD